MTTHHSKKAIKSNEVDKAVVQACGWEMNTMHAMKLRRRLRKLVREAYLRGCDNNCNCYGPCGCREAGFVNRFGFKP